MKIKNICIFHKWKTYTNRSPVVYKQCKKCNKIKTIYTSPMGYLPYDLTVDIGE